MGNFQSNVEHALLRQLKKGNGALLDRVKTANRIYLHNYQVEVKKRFTCQLEGCSKQYSVKLIPNQVLYPKYCEEHRTIHRRQHFIKAKLTKFKPKFR